MVLTATDNTSWWVAPHWHDHMRMVVSTAHWSKHIADCRRVALWTHALCETEDWACALKKQVLDETGANGTAFLHNAFQTEIMLTKSLQLSNGSDEHIMMMPCLNDSRSMSLFSQQATSSTLVMTGWRHNQHHHRDTQMDCSTTRTSCSSIHHSWWTQTSGVTTMWKHAMCIVHSNQSIVLNEQHCDECEQSGMNENHKKALRPHSQPRMACCTPHLSPYSTNRLVQAWQENDSG